MTQTRDPYSEPNQSYYLDTTEGVQNLAKFEGVYGKSSQWEDGEHALMAAILGDTLNTLRDSHDNPKSWRKRLFREAERWVMTTSEDDWVFSFDSVCSALKFDPSAVRAVLRRKYELRLATLKAVPVVLHDADPHASHQIWRRGCQACVERSIKRREALRERGRARAAAQRQVLRAL